MSDGKCKILFTRPLKPTGLPEAQNIVIGKEVTVVVARGGSPELGSHSYGSQEYRGSIAVNFFEGEIHQDETEETTAKTTTNEPKPTEAEDASGQERKSHAIVWILLLVQGLVAVVA